MYNCALEKGVSFDRNHFKDFLEILKDCTTDDKIKKSLGMLQWNLNGKCLYYVIDG